MRAQYINEFKRGKNPEEKIGLGNFQYTNELEVLKKNKDTEYIYPQRMSDGLFLHIYKENYLKTHIPGTPDLYNSFPNKKQHEAINNSERPFDFTSGIYKGYLINGPYIIHQLQELLDME